MPSINRNLHRIDRILRSLVALGCIYVGFINPLYIGDQFLAWGVAVFGAVNLLAAAIGSCPFYAAAGISTYQPKTSPV
jgi:hypothetical protein